MTENMRQFMLALNKYDNAWLKMIIKAEQGLDTEREEVMMKMHGARLISKFKQADEQ